MRLDGVEIKGYRSLHQVSLEGLSKFNVLVGRNNAGKSSVLRALQHVSNAAFGQAAADARIFPDEDPSTALELRLTFLLHDSERQTYLDPLKSRPPLLARIAESDFARKLSVHASSRAGAPQPLFVREVGIMAEDGEWATIAAGGDMDRLAALDIGSHLALLARRNPSLTPTVLGPSGGGHTTTTPSELSTWVRGVGPGAWFGAYMAASFFLSPFRMAAEEVQAVEATQLAPDGSNLAQLLHSIHSNDPHRFRRIEEMVHAAIPDVGDLVTPLTSTSTFVGFRQGSTVIRTKAMGTGVEELLMVAAILETVSEPNLFLEEPEGHLHPGAQRYLMDLLMERSHQAMVATHSPVFLSPSVESRTYRVSLEDRRTSVSAAPDAAGLDAALGEIGSRNSDLLLSDAVLFVEGPSDAAILRALAGALETPLLLSRITVLHLGGTDAPNPKAKVRSEVLSGISSRTPIPHLFVLDRDERSAKEMRSLSALVERVVVLGARELENYLLVPRAMREAMREKYKDSSVQMAALDPIDTLELQRLIERHAHELYGHVLIKRVRGELGGIAGGFIAREAVERLAAHAGRSSLATEIRRHVVGRIEPAISASAIRKVIADVQKALDKEWKKKGGPLRIAPGADVLARVYSHVGGQYDKAKDGERIARHLVKADIPPDLEALLKRAAALA